MLTSHRQTGKSLTGRPVELPKPRIASQVASQVQSQQEKTPEPALEEQTKERDNSVWRAGNNQHTSKGMSNRLLINARFISSFSGPCQFLLDDTPPDGGSSYIQLIAERRVLVRFGMSYENTVLHDRLTTVDPRRISPHPYNTQPEFHEVCVAFTDQKSRLCHENVDICHLKPEPPKAKGKSLLLLCSPSGPFGPYIMHRVKRSSKIIIVKDESSKKTIKYRFDQCVHVLNAGKEK